MLITKFRLRKQEDHEEEIEGLDEEFFKQKTPSETSSKYEKSKKSIPEIEEYSRADLNKPLLSSKKKLSSFLIQRSVSPKIEENENSIVPAKIQAKKKLEEKKNASLSPVKK